MVRENNFNDVGVCVLNIIMCNLKLLLNFPARISLSKPRRTFTNNIYKIINISSPLSSCKVHQMRDDAPENSFEKIYTLQVC